jgi:large subunit ribosomal protein L25
MKAIEISAKLRTETGKANSRELRKSGNVPCVIYGGGSNLHFYAPQNAFTGLIYTHESHVVHLDIEGKKISAILKEIQYHPVTDAISHIDFIAVAESKPVVIGIPIKVVGVSPGVKAGGKLRIKARNLKVRGLVKDIPEFLTVDISELNIHQSIKVGDLSYPGIELIDSKKDMVLSVATARGVAKDAEDAAADEALATAAADASAAAKAEASAE